VAFTVGLEAARTACAESIGSFLSATDGFAEYDLLGASRCHGWTRLDVVVHTIGGWQEMLGGLAAVVDAEPTVDAASYWPAFAAEIGSGDPVTTLMAQRRRTAVYSRPSSACEHLRDVAGMLQRGVEHFADRPCTWQGHVFAPGDFLAIWVVENAIHHLDLLSGEPAPRAALGMARATVEALVQEALPTTWTDEDAVLIGTGRSPVPAGLTSLAERLPALG
jgi:hypothetical protein